MPKKLIRKFKGIVHYFMRFPIPQQRIKVEKDFSYRKKKYSAGKKTYCQGPQLSSQSKIFTIHEIQENTSTTIKKNLSFKY